MSEVNQQLALVIQKSEEQNATTQGFLDEADARIDTMDVRVTDFIATAHSKSGTAKHVGDTTDRTSQISPFDNVGGSIWTAAFMTSNTLVAHFESGTIFANKDPEIQALLTAMGRGGQQYTKHNFEIRRIQFNRTGGYGHALPYVQVIADAKQKITVAAWVKHVSGAVPSNHYCNGLNANDDWKLCGKHLTSSPNGYQTIHPFAEGQGEILIALPAIVDRYVDLSDPLNWYVFEN